MKTYLTHLALFVILLSTGCQKNVQPTGAGRSSAGALNRYDLVQSDYDVSQPAAFTVSYDSQGKMANLFQKQGQSLSSFALGYEGDRLTTSVANDKSTQKISYDASGRPVRVDYSTLTDTGKIVYSYDAGGKLIGYIDSIKQPLRLPLIYQYLFTWDAQRNNVVKVVQNRLDLEGRPTLQQYTLYTFDDKSNPFLTFPYLRYSSQLPGQAAALVNRNNILSSQVTGTVLDASSPGSTPVFDTVTQYRTTRTYEYTGKGFPTKATETFIDLQYNYTGKRTFKYEY